MVVERADLERRAEAAGEVRPQEGDGPGEDLGHPQPEPGADRAAHQLPPRQPLHLVRPERLDRLLGQGLRLVDRLDVVVAHRGWILRSGITGRSSTPGAVTNGMMKV